MRLLTTLLLWLTLTLPALAACDGQDLRETLTPEERAALDDLLAERPFPQGNHWRATRDGQVIHLIGTMHLDDPRFDAVMARLTPLIDGADTVLLEMTAAEQAEMQRAFAVNPDMLVMPDTTLPELMDEAEWQRLSSAIRARGMPPFMAAKFRPWYLAMLLSMPTCLDMQSAAEAGLDAQIEARADAQGIPTRALEPFDTAFEAFGETTMDTQIAMLRAAIVPDGAADDLFATLLEGYFDEAHAQSWAITEVLAPRFGPMDPDDTAAIFEAMDGKLLEDRNRAWIPVILDTVAQARGPVVAAFGAAHLSGPDGVLALLEQEGFTLERLPF